ncbi:rab-GTPase-TBC domain-containing protein [Parasitella parasitica]|nr:rab-GTPase-TBC domain-containing protein [Parasitella parasitica]
MTMKHNHENNDSYEDISGTLSTTHINDDKQSLAADKLLDELGLPPHQQSLYINSANSHSQNTYDQFFEEVSLDLPRDSKQEAEPSRLLKFMPRRGGNTIAISNNSNNNNNNNNSNTTTATSKPSDGAISPSDISGPFYSISDVLDDSVSPTATAAAIAAATASIASGNDNGYESVDMSQVNPRAARRNVNEAEVIVTSGGASIPTKKKSTLNPFKRSKSTNQKPSPLETVVSKTRPRMLPPKNPQEEKKHLQEYESMMKQAKKLQAKKQRDSDRKREEKDKKVSYAIHTWENDIIPHWKSRVKDKRTLVLWDQGIPPRCRKKVWRLKIGNQLNITKSTFSECTRRVPQAVRNTKSTNDSHGAAVPIVTASNHSTYDPLAEIEQQVYVRSRQRRTSSLNVLRERDDDQEDNADDEHDDDGAAFSNFTNMPEHASSTNSFTSNEDNFDRCSQSEGGRSAFDLGSHHEDDNIGLEDDDDQGDTSDQDDEPDDDDLDDDDKVLKDPAAISFLNKAIDEDILRTLPSLCVFQPDGPLFMSLRKVLHAFVGYRPNMTYSRGTSFLAGVLLLNMNAQDTFTALINLISGSQVLSALYNSDEKKIQGFFKVFNVIFAENLPKLYLHFKNLTLTPENYLPDWFMTIFASIIPLELSSRLWDIYLLHGDIILFRTGLAVLKYLEPLLWGSGFGETVRILNMGFIGEHRGEEVKAALAVSGHITEGDEDPFFDEILGRKGVHLDKTRFKELLGAHMPRTTRQ